MALTTSRQLTPPASKLSRLQPAQGVDERLAVMVIDDDPLVGTLLRELVEGLGGFRLDTARSLAEAELLLRRHRGSWFCAVVSDSLPDVPAGTAVAALDARGVPTIVLAEDDESCVALRARTRHVVDCVAKHGLHQIEHVVYLLGRLRENRRTKVLVVDPTREYRRRLVDLLERYFYYALEARDGIDALAQLDAHPDLSLVITGIELPRLDGTGLIAEIRRRHRREHLAIIGICDARTPGLPARILRTGGNDLLPREFEVEEFYCRVTQNTNMVGYLRQIRDSANRDFLTGLCNRRHLFELGEKLHARARLGRTHLAACIVDIDHFKRINDTYGHEAGDLALQAIARRLADTLRDDDVIARYGGEEFVCLTPLEQLADAGGLFERVRSDIESLQVDLGERGFGLTASLGVTNRLDDSFEAMLRHADAAVYRAKRDGRNRVVEN
jgi:diguanylate cyclase (GGDEF)-like protein